MTFDLTPEQDAWSRRAREFADAVLATRAQEIDEHGVIPADLHDALASHQLGNPFDDGAVAAAVAIEGLAAVSAGVAAAIGFRWAGHTGTLPAARGRLVLCAVAVGVGRSAVAIGVESMRSRDIKPSGDEPTPHWLLADAAAEVDAARLLVWSAAQSLDGGADAGAALSMAGRLSSAAAEHAVEAASRIVGVEGYRPGSSLDRLTRHARALTLRLST